MQESPAELVPVQTDSTLDIPTKPEHFPIEPPVPSFDQQFTKNLPRLIGQAIKTGQLVVTEEGLTVDPMVVMADHHRMINRYSKTHSLDDTLVYSGLDYAQTVVACGGLRDQHKRELDESRGFQ